MEVLLEFKFVVTVALKQELDLEWLSKNNIPCVTYKAINSGILSQYKNNQSSVLVIVTGVGADVSFNVACFIRDKLKPMYVINFGTAGSKLYPIGSFKQQSSFFPGASGYFDSGIVDMEAKAQFDVFRNSTKISFQSFKYITDANDENKDYDFYKYLSYTKSFFPSLFKPLNEPFSISVVIPSFNRSKSLPRAINSVLRQTFKPLEIIVVDDASTDETLQVLSEYEHLISLISLPNNKGVSYARNQAIKQSKGNWISFLDSDDEWIDEKLENQINYLKKNPYFKVIQSDEKWIRNGNLFNRKKHHLKEEGWLFSRSLERCMISPSSVMLHRSVFEQFGLFNERLPVCEDYDLWLRITPFLPVAFDPSAALIKYGGHIDQLSTSYPIMDQYRVQALENLIDQLEDAKLQKCASMILEQKKEIIMKGRLKRQN